jgi:hypothetical protein
MPVRAADPAVTRVAGSIAVLETCCDPVCTTAPVVILSVQLQHGRYSHSVD